MRLLSIKEPDRSWRAIKSQWKRDAESAGDDLSSFGGISAFDALATRDGDNPGLYCLADGDRFYAVCQVKRLLMSKYPTPILRARFVNVSPELELSGAGKGEYARIMVALFCGVVWLARDAMAAGHIRFLLKSPGDAPFFTALQAATERSPFSSFTVDGAMIECSLKEAPAELAEA